MKTQHKKSEYTLTPEEIITLINSAESFRNRLILECLYYGGMRVGEVERLEVQDIHFERNTIDIMQSKFNKSRTIPITDITFKSNLRHYIGHKTKDKVFSIKKRMMQRIVEETGIKAKITPPDPSAIHLNAHLLRHSIARHLKSSKYSIEWIQKFLGHSNMSTTADTYGTLSLNEMQLILTQKTGSKALLPYKEV